MRVIAKDTILPPKVKGKAKLTKVENGIYIEASWTLEMKEMIHVLYYNDFQEELKREKEKLIRQIIEEKMDIRFDKCCVWLQTFVV